MNKLEVQARVLQNGKPLDLDKFSWDEKSCTFSTIEDRLTIDFSGVNNCTFKTSSYCIFKTGDCCTFNTGACCTFNTGNNCTFDTCSCCIFDTSYECTFDTGGHCTFKTSDDCTFSTGACCIFDTGGCCIFNTNWNCTFDTGYGCTFDTGGYCTFNIWEKGHFINKRDKNLVIVRCNNDYKIVELDNLPKDKFIKVDRYDIVKKDIKEYRYIDDSIYILHNTKQVDNYTIYKAEDIEDYFKDKNNTCYVAQLGTLYAHADSIKEAIEDVQFKHLQTKDVQEHITRVKEQGYITANDYRLLTGACRYGTNKWLEEHNYTWEDKKSIDEVIELTKGQYGHNRLVELLKGE